MKFILILSILLNYKLLIAQDNNINYDSIANRIDSIFIENGFHINVYNKNLFCFIIGLQQNKVRFHHKFGKGAIMIDSIPYILSYLYNIISPAKFTIIRKTNLAIAKYEDSNVSVGLVSKINYIENVSGHKFKDTSISFINFVYDPLIANNYKNLKPAKSLNFVYLDCKLLSQIKLDSFLITLNNWTKTNFQHLYFSNGHYCLNGAQINMLNDFLVSRNISFKIERNKLKGRVIY